MLIVGPPRAGKTVLALALLYKALKAGPDHECGLFLTTEQTAGYLVDSVTGLFMADLQMRFLAPSRVRLNIMDFPPIDPPADEPAQQAEPAGDRVVADTLVERLREVTWDVEPTPRHLVLDSLTAMQTVLRSRAEARRLTQLLLGMLSFPRDRLDLMVVTAEAHAGFTARHYSERLHDSFDEYLFDTVIYLDIIETPADRRLRTIEIPKSRGRHARTGRHTFSIVNHQGLPSLIHSHAGQQEIRTYDTPVIIFPREPRSERPTEAAPASGSPAAEYLQTGITGLDALLDREHRRGLLKRSTTVLIGGPGDGVESARVRVSGAGP
jgi:KaiC/GvpD/RAD55 family RecA-like ATPase